MSVFTAATFLGLLTLAAFVFVLGVAVVWILDRIGVLEDGVGRLATAIGPLALWLAFVVALTATSGSLYFSEVAHFTPCALCWYQRIAMYPMVVILGIAALRDDRGVARYAVPLAAIGAFISAWHIGVERIPGLPSGACSLDVPCSLIYVEVVGFVTIPTMALAGFLSIITLLLLARSASRQPELETHA
ncbi:MAG TPA: disulfide oxidoreductase [Candidatus Limnocylindria bacterium]|nr:disulfide oxidoreductase [Candidatus Limnocylindria bacterium]